MLVNYIFRNKKKGGFSIEELFTSIISNLPPEVEVNIVELPYDGASLRSVVLNIFHVIRLKGIIHITGDVHYLALLPFKKIVLTIHDVKFIKGSLIKRIFLTLFWFWIPSLFVKKITVISEFSKKQVLEIIPWAKNKTTVMYNPLNPKLERNTKSSISKKPNILHIGTKKNKNLFNTIKGLKNIPCVLVIVGKLTQEQKKTLVEFQITYKNYINVPFAKINELYAQSDIVSFISLFEGFGMPVIEAQQVGRVLITTRKGAIPEIASNSVHYVNPEDPDAIQKGFLRLINDKEYTLSLIDKGFKNVERFNLDVITNQYLSLYKKL